MSVSAPKASLAPRSDFPVLADVTYLNTGSFGLEPLPVRRASQEFEESIGGRGTVGFDDEVEARVYDDSRRAAASLIGAHEDDIAITTSVSEALGQLAWWLKPGSDANVVSIDTEFPSVTYPWLRVAEDTGTDVRLVPALQHLSSLTLEDVAGCVDDDTAVICVSHVQYGTGHRLDPRGLAELAHAHGAILILDAYQSAGVVPIDVSSADVDILVAGGCKWLCAGPGAAFCYMRPELRERFRPAFVGWRSTPNPPDFDATKITLAPQMRRMEYATMAYGAGLALGAAIRYLLELGVDGILQHNLGLGTRLIDGLEAIGAEVRTGRDPQGRAGIVNGYLPGRDNGQVTRRLNEAGIIVSPRLGGTRFSMHMFNDEDDVTRVIEVLERIVATPDEE